MNVEICPGCLAPGFDTYCNKCLKKFFNGKKINHLLNFSREEFDNFTVEKIGSISLPGKQIKGSLKLDNKELILSEKGEFILKPTPSGQIENSVQIPFNEHLTMQIANQAYDINTAKNGIVFFKDGEAAYFTKRFDIHINGNKLLQEDFAQIAERTGEINGENYKYDYSYEEVAELMKKYVGAYSIEIEKYLKIIIFNFLFSNNDFHLKNLSLCRNEEYGDYLLTPFYDLSNTLLHFPDNGNPALKLFKENSENADKTDEKYTQQDFREFAQRIGIKEKRFNYILTTMLSKSSQVKDLLSKSFLNEKLKTTYLETYLEKYEILRENIL